MNIPGHQKVHSMRNISYQAYGSTTYCSAGSEWNHCGMLKLAPHWSTFHPLLIFLFFSKRLAPPLPSFSLSFSLSVCSIRAKVKSFTIRENTTALLQTGQKD